MKNVWLLWVMWSAMTLEALAQDTPVLPPVTSTATRTERPVADSPSTVTVITDEEIERQVVRDITDLTRYEPGVSAPSQRSRFGPNSYTIRGIGGNRVLIQIDGIRLPDAFAFGSFGSAPRDVVDIDALKTVEILRGPGSALYGSDALAGVVTYITKDPGDLLAQTSRPVFASLKAGYQTADEGLLGTGILAAGRGALSGLLVYTGRSGNELDNQGDNDVIGPLRTTPNPQDYESSNLLAKLVFKLNPANAFKLTFDRFDADTETEALNLNPQTPRTAALFGDDNVKRQRVSLDYEHRDSVGALFNLARLQLYRQDSETDQRTEEIRNNTTATCSGVAFGANQCLLRRQFRFDQELTGVNAQLEKALAAGSWSHYLTYGFEAYRTDTSQLRDATRINQTTGVVSNTILPDVFPVRDFPESETTQIGVYLQDEVSPGSGRFSIIPGLRYDYYKLKPRADAIFFADNPATASVDVKEDAISPKVGAIYRLTGEYSLFGQYAQGFRAPPFNDVNAGFTNFAFGYTAIPNPDLESETSRGIELGLRRTSSRVNFSAAAFYNRYKDFIETLSPLPCPGDSRCVPGFPITF